MLVSPTIKLQPTGAEMPQVGFGTWKHYGQKASDAVYEGLKVGYRLFDCACDYDNEKGCGAGLKRAIDEGIVKREEVWVVSKLWNTYHRKEHVREAVMRSLKDWGVSYFDIYYMHFPISLAFVPFETRYPPGWYYDGKAEVRLDPVPIRETWEALEELMDEGYIKHLGVSNMNSGLLMDLLSYARIKPSVLQVEIHPYNAQFRLVEYAHSLGIAVTGYSSFGPLGFRELNMKKALDTQPLFTHPLITALAASHACTPAQIVLRWATQRGIAVIPKSGTVRMMQDNMRNVEVHLSEEEMQEVGELDRGLRFNEPADDFAGCYIFC
ncbi:Probable NAD(P)H-dependent D-xylose reductase [Sparassis crispa]|uniref:Probable NAD(P)H-dependent D-xylose reductase n=1 Tax=Sparassis crispa TaxID=139825 RepID=A0A401GX92_9APHY|nr:Probable NAD(P)H-dependent D-xylose reductase [Sparassis crispa]GBE86845.1 Probable NAD(P)H-dependent D-xylose reductase [Sparassis crispa]